MDPRDLLLFFHIEGRSIFVDARFSSLRTKDFWYSDEINELRESSANQHFHAVWESTKRTFVIHEKIIASVSTLIVANEFWFLWFYIVLQSSRCFHVNVSLRHSILSSVSSQKTRRCDWKVLKRCSQQLLPFHHPITKLKWYVVIGVEGMLRCFNKKKRLLTL